MRKLNVFNFITLNGFYKGANDDINWHKHGVEENKYASEMLDTGSTLLFGRVTYEMMAAYWPTSFAINNDPDVARGMNEAEKIVFSGTIKKTEWNNTRIINENIIEETKKLKQSAGNDLTILGSGTIISQFAQEGLIDEYKIMVDPVALSEGTPIFRGINRNLHLKLTETKVFKSGVILLCYKPL